MLRRRFFAPILVFLFATAAHAQQPAVISGVLRDSLNRPLFGGTVAVFGEPFGTTSGDDGKYRLSVPSDRTLRIIFSYTGLKSDTLDLRLNPGEERSVNRTLRGRIYQIKDVTIEERSLRELNMTPIDPKSVTALPTPNQSVEDLLKTMPGVSSSNELSSQYNVRGGNFDENLVYINDFEIYRPLLVRSGQQEGISIIHPDMVESIRFSAGGFDAVYGDKLSSVLDIRYRKPVKFSGSAYASLLGGGLELEDRSANEKWYWMAGLRQKSNQYLLNSFETKGEYRPSFTDGQVLMGWEASPVINIELFGNYARNRFNLIPENRETNFGTINDAKRFTVYFEGRELDRYITFTGAASVTYRPSATVKLKFIASAYKTREEENFDILGQYFLDQLEADLGKDNFGDVAFNLGVGSFLSHARNRLDATVKCAEHRGERISDNGLFSWGIKVQEEHFEDAMHEWNYNDSAGFSIPSERDPANPEILLNDVVIAKNNLSTQRASGFVQNTWQLGDSRRFTITAGIRGLHYSLSGQTVFSPRGSLNFRPDPTKPLTFRAAAGVYYQAPFYREVRGVDGTLYPGTPAQKSVHFVVGNDYSFQTLGRDFKLTSEIYYKSLDVLIPYKIDNLRIRYLPDERSKGYSTGIDLRLFGEFVRGTESWASLSYMKTEEDILGDFYYDRYNRYGEKIVPGYTYDQVAVDSVRQEPGFIARPADQRVTFSMFFQDYLPKTPTVKMSLFLAFGTGLPFGPPGEPRYKDIFRAPPYRRVDISCSKQLIGEGVKKKPSGALVRNVESMWLGLEVFNLLQVSNVASYTWVTDVSNDRKYAVPNYLTARQLNVRLNVRF
ncbi:MAG: hypothetical protein RL213_87 [Bacteroidota bacterium]